MTLNFPNAPTNGQVFQGYQYNTAKGVWARTNFSALEASTTNLGIVELADSTETLAGTDATRAVTPAGLAALTSTTARRGLVELALDSEVLAGTDASKAVTPLGLRSHKGIPFAMAANIVTGPTSLAAATGLTRTVTFPSGRFTVGPSIVASPTTSSRLNLSILTTTSTSATVRLDNFTTATATDSGFHWHAIQMTSTTAGG